MSTGLSDKAMSPNIVAPQVEGHIYLVEDDDAMRESMRRILASQGYRVYPFADPQKFLEFVMPVSPTMVLLDMRMPGMTGVEVQARLRAMGMDMPIVFVSGESTVQQAVTALEEGALKFLIKPVSRVELLRAVCEALERDVLRAATEKKRLHLDSHLAKLAPREREALALMLDGHGNAEISKRMGIAYATAKQYKANILLKMNVQNMAEVIDLMRLSPPSWRVTQESAL